MDNGLFNFRILKLVALCLALNSVLLAKNNKPNIIYILADDLGYGELGSYGQTKIKTPFLDTLAAQGMKFTQHYSGAQVCAPSRFTLITGKHIGRSETYGQRQKLKPNEFTVAKMLKEKGYVTGCFGKWGLGNDPNAQGFDEWCGFIDQGYAHFYYPERIWRDTVQVELPENKGLRVDGKYKEDYNKGTYIHDVFIDTALKFIADNEKSPFFLYLPLTIPHLELIAPQSSLEQYQGKWEEKEFDTKIKEKTAGGRKFYDGYGYCSNDNPRATYAAMVSRMDRDIGRIMELLKKLNLEENTLIIFSSDNGPSWWDVGGYDRDFFQGAGPLRGGKATFFEGGIRIPMIACWPGTINPGTESDHISYFPDVLPTLAEIAGAKVPEGIDGVSMLPTFLEKGKQEQHEFLFWAGAVRMGEWKFVHSGKELKGKQPMLFNLSEDIGETKDLAVQHPEIVEQIKEIIQENKIPKNFRKYNLK